MQTQNKGGRFWFPSASSQTESRCFSFRAFRRLVAAEADFRPSLRLCLRLPAGVLQPAKPPSLCGPASTPAPSFVIRRTDFSFWGRASPTDSDLFRLSRNTVSQSGIAVKLPEVHRGRRIESRAGRLTGRCPVTMRLMSQMIGMMLENGESAVELFQQNDARQFVRQRHLAQRERKSGSLARFVTETIAAANREEQRDGV
jgi:hypothetical protein